MLLVIEHNDLPNEASPNVQPVVYHRMLIH